MQAWSERLLYGQLLAVVTGWNRPEADIQADRFPLGVAGQQ